MASEENQDEVTFSITLNSDEAIDPKLVADTIKDAQSLLSDLELNILGATESRVQWSWADDRPIELTAHVNGASREQLGRIVTEAERGFAAIPSGLSWPESFSKHAKATAKRIVRRLESVDSIAVRAERHPPVVIESSQLPHALLSGKSASRKKLHATVEGVLDVVSVRGRLKASVTETNSNRVVKVHLTDDLFERVKEVLKQRVVLEGMVSYRDDATPVSVSDIAGITLRKVGRPLDAFIGAAPNITGGLETLDYIDRIRGEDE